MNEVTRILEDIQQGDPHAAEQLLPLVYDELRRLAVHHLACERPGQTLDATALVHEAYLRLVKPEEQQRWDSRGHFFVAAATAMRRILIENARRKARARHGGEWRRVGLVEIAEVTETDDHERLLTLDRALSRLAADDPQAAQVVELHHFAGLSHDVVAEALGITVYRARQKWTYARAFLQADLAEP